MGKCVDRNGDEIRPGDLVYVLDGDAASDYRSGWVEELNQFVGRTMVVRSVDNWIVTLCGAESVSSYWYFDSNYLILETTGRCFEDNKDIGSYIDSF